MKVMITLKISTLLLIIKIIYHKLNSITNNLLYTNKLHYQNYKIKALF